MPNGRVTVASPRHAFDGRLAELVMAWASDAATGEPRYILELDADRRGARSGCVCAGCGQPLIAVNAAKQEYIRRPHFRHHEGADRHDCVVLAARAAVLRQMQADGWIELPRRRMSGTAIGLSGTKYEAWIELSPERLQIRRTDYADRARAVFTFDDGRRLTVGLTGTLGSGSSDHGSPEGEATILIGVDDPEIAAMSPEAIRSRLRLLPDPMCWQTHWADSDSRSRANAQARHEAVTFLDEVPPGLTIPEGVDPALKRESILHFKAKEILDSEGRVAVPGFLLQVSASSGSDSLSASWELEEDVLQLDHIELESPWDDIVPDVTCKAYPIDGGRVYVPSMIEVTVTNQIHGERLDRIRSKRQLALEVDLSACGGRVTLDELRRLVIEETDNKRWLFHPEIEEHREALAAQLRARLQRRESVRAAPLEDITREYLAAVIARLHRYRDVDDPAGGEGELGEALADAVDKMALRGFLEAGDSLVVESHGILDRILSIKSDVGIGYRLPTGFAVLNAIRQSRSHHRQYHSLFLIAGLVYRPTFNESQKIWFDKWRVEVRESINAKEETYLRPTTYDRLLSLLFPEMAASLQRPGGKRAARGSRQRDSSGPVDPERRRAYFLTQQPRADGVSWRLQDTKPHEFWLRGRDLERWRSQNPDWAKFWAANAPNT